jgi:hypothetical protein
VFLLLETVFFKEVGSEKFCLAARLSFKRYFLSYSFHTLKQIRLKIGDPKRGKCHTGGGGQKNAKKVSRII